MTNPKVLLSWSSGKDSAWALHVLRQQPDLEVVGLLTTFNEEFDRVAMHAVRRELVEAQAAAAGLPLIPVMLPYPCTNEVYEDRMKAAIAEAKAAGVTHMAFGDLFLADIREYRVRLLEGTGVEPLFPIWTTARGHARPGSSDAGGGSRSGPDLRGPQAIGQAVRGSAVRRDALGGSACWGRSLRRTGRVSHVLLPVPRVQHGDPGDRRRCR